MPPAGFQPTISAGEQPQTYALDRAATGTGESLYIYLEKISVTKKLASVFLRYIQSAKIMEILEEKL